jgi:hypothetical protein
MFILQVFSPASVIFAGIGVFLSASILYLFLGANLSDFLHLLGGPECCGEQRRSR